MLKSEAELATVQQPQETIPVETVQESPKEENKEKTTSAVVSKPSFFTVIKNLKIWNIVFGVSFIFSLFAFAIFYMKSKKRIEQPQNNKKK